MKVIDVEQGSFEWLQLRMGKITGTRLGDVLGTPKARQTLMCELIAEQMTEQVKEVRMNDAMERGKVEEGFARKEYEVRTGNKVETVGFIIADHLDERVAFSPDGVVRNEAGEIVGGIEIKNPDSKTHVGYLIANEIPKDYMEQVMMAFIAIPTLLWWDFVSFDSRVKIAEKRMMIKRITRTDLSQGLLFADVEIREFLKKWDDAYSKLIF